MCVGAGQRADNTRWLQNSSLGLPNSHLFYKESITLCEQFRSKWYRGSLRSQTLEVNNASARNAFEVGWMECCYPKSHTDEPMNRMVGR